MAIGQIAYIIFCESKMCSMHKTLFPPKSAQVKWQFLVFYLVCLVFAYSHIVYAWPNDIGGLLVHPFWYGVTSRYIARSIDLNVADSI